MQLMAWLLTTEGITTRLDAVGVGLRDVIQTAIGSDLITAVPVVMGVYLWTDMLSQLHNREMNVAAMGFADRMLNVTEPDLPRIHGSVVIAAVCDGEPAEMGQAGIESIRERFAA